MKAFENFVIFLSTFVVVSAIIFLYRESVYGNQSATCTAKGGASISYVESGKNVRACAKVQILYKEKQ